MIFNGKYVFEWSQTVKAQFNCPCNEFSPFIHPVNQTHAHFRSSKTWQAWHPQSLCPSRSPSSAPLPHAALPQPLPIISMPPFIVLHSCCLLYNLKAKPYTSKKITAHFIATLTLLQWSGTKPAISLRYACTLS